MKAVNKRKMYLLSDFIAVNMAIFFSLIIKYDAKIPLKYLYILPFTFILATCISFIVYYIFGLYSMLWVYASVDELLKIFFATVVSIIIQYIVYGLLNIRLPITVYPIFWMILFLLTGGSRLSTRIIKNMRLLKNKTLNKRRIMIIGAGEAASMLIKDIRNNRSRKYDPVIAVDDDPTKHGTQINGIPVIGGRDKIVKAAKEMSIEEIVISIPSISRKETIGLINIAKETGCKLKVLPSVYNLVNEDVSIKKIRDVTIEDLLQREEINLSIDEISGYLNGKTILVTGGGGSIGSELCRQIAEYKPKSLLIFDIYENNAYDLQNELLEKYKDSIDFQIIIGSIRDKNRLDYVFSNYKPSIVFHAAAHKHVPLMEDNPQEAVKNNIFGTLNLAECADENGVEKFVLISTDKAVNPTSIMGATKRAAELVIQYMNRVSSTKFCAVRFGNVLGSSGSVIPLFKRQIENGGPISVTHPDIIRYFMTIPEAASLVIQSGAMMEGGEIFVLDMGEQVKIVDLAKSLITLSGFEPDIDIEIKYVGLRPGEKLYEELLVSEDGVDITKNNKIFIEKPKEIDFNSYMSKITSFQQSNLEEREEIIQFVKQLIPTYQNKL